MNVLKNIKIGLKRHIIRVTNIKSAERVKDILKSTVKLNDYRLMLMKRELFELLCM